MVLMEQTMRWFGPKDPVSLSDIRQSGCSGVVTALHEVPVGEVWPMDAIMTRKKLIERAGLSWNVIESLPVHDDIKRKSGNFKQYIENYRKSIRNVAKSGLKVITYNFMPVLDWVRTHIDHITETNSRALMFDRASFIAFDLFILRRTGSEKDYTKDEAKEAETSFKLMTEEEKESLSRNVLLGLPGSDGRFTRDQVLEAIHSYSGVSRAELQQNLFSFLQEVVPVAEDQNIELAIHPDDPPFPVLGLPRVMSTEQDASDLINAVDSPANGLCFCTGSFGVLAKNDLPGMIRRLGKRIHFLHLRNTTRFGSGSFLEASHLEGDADMPAVVKEIVLLMQLRNKPIPMRPDHGHQMLDDLNKKTYPGYSAIGRLKGLAELRGLELGISRYAVV